MGSRLCGDVALGSAFRPLAKPRPLWPSTPPHVQGGEMSELWLLMVSRLFLLLGQSNGMTSVHTMTQSSGEPDGLGTRLVRASQPMQ